MQKPLSSMYTYTVYICMAICSLHYVAAWTVNKEWFGGNSFPWGHNDESSHYLADLAAATSQLGQTSKTHKKLD